MLRCCRLPLSLAMVMMISRAILQRKTNGRHFAIVTHAFRPSLTVLVPFFRKRGRVVDQRLQWRTSDSDRGHAEFTVSPASRMHRVAAFSKALSSSAAYSDENEVTTNTKTIKTTSAPAIITTRVDGNSPILQGLNPSQVDAVTQPVASITRVVAGPGSGKTRVLTSRIAWLLQQKASNHRILGVTFTRKASGEMQQRLNKLLVEQQQLIMSKSSDIAEETVGDVKATPAGLERVTLGTFHSICAKILRWNGDHLVSLPSVVDDMSKSSSRPVLDGTFNIADQGEQIRIIKESLTEANIDLKSYDLKPLQVLSAVSRCKSILAMGENPFPDENGKKQTIRPVMHIAKKIYFRYREMLLSSNCIDFDDLIYLTRELLLINEEIRDRLQKRWNHVLVDEFQDTSQTQMDLIKLLTSSSLFVVGDADQSIYSWRGAHAGSLSDFEHEFKKYNVDGVSTVYLMENYRSTSNIVRAAQKVISASGDSASGADKLRQMMIPKRSAGLSPRVIACADARKEAEFVVKKVKEMISTGVYGFDHSVAFIYRTNAQSRALEEACVKYNLPYVIFGSATSFYKRQEIKDCLCFLRWLYNGRDRISMLRAMGTPKRGIGDTAIREFDAYCADVDQLWDEIFPEATKPSPLEVLFHLSGDDSWCSSHGAQFPPPSVSLSTRPLKLLTKFSKQMVGIQRLATEASVEQVLSTIVNEMDLIPHLDKISKSKTEFEERQANVQELQQATRRYTDAGACLLQEEKAMGENEVNQSPLGNFLDDVALVTEMTDNAERSTEDRFVANLMTIHASKGMEFDTVFFVGIEDGTLPTMQALQEGEGSVVYEEEKRLCYVAMTRAKTELVMSWRQEVPVFTADGSRTVTKKRSRFLDVLLSKEQGSSYGKIDKSAKSPEQAQLARSRSSNALSRDSGNSQTISGTKYGTVPFEGRRVSPSPPPPMQAQNTKKLTGTASVYARTLQSPFVAMAKAPLTPKIPPNTTSRPSKASESSYLPSQHVTSALSQRKEALSSQNVIEPQSIDSTWFFPVGSKVSHQQLGIGIVLPPLPPGKDGEMAVFVKFCNGEQREFPVHTADLSPIVI